MELPEEAFGSFVAPLGIGSIQLADGRSVKAFLCEAYAVRGSEDITASKGWRAWLSARRLAKLPPVAQADHVR
jgi:allophanate hydrolase